MSTETELHPFSELLLVRFGHESLELLSEQAKEAINDLFIETNNKLIQGNRVGMVNDLEYWKAWNKVTNALSNELKAAEHLLGDDMIRAHWESVGKAIDNIDFLKDFNNGLKPITQNLEAFSKNVNSIFAAAELVVVLNNEDATTYEVGNVAMTALGGFIAGLIIAEVTMAFLPAIAIGVLGGLIGKLLWEEVIAPYCLGLDPEDAPLFWDQFYDNNAWARNVAQIATDTWSFFFGARGWVERRDPLVLDLDGDGIETTGINGYANTVLFDHDGDGVKTGTGWVKGDDAFLALDRNGNGLIDSGRELFGVDTVLANGQRAANGFAALAGLDSNGDGLIDAQDAQFAQLRLWRDLDQNGVSDEGELLTLAEAGIDSINLASVTTNTNLAGGNIQTAQGAYTMCTLAEN
jgi:hypothetical protein